MNNDWVELGLNVSNQYLREESIADELGLTTLVLRVQWFGMPRQRVLDQIRLIGESVLPRLEKLTRSRAEAR